MFTAVCILFLINKLAKDYFNIPDVGKNKNASFCGRVIPFQLFVSILSSVSQAN